jgi:hypothetical protein
MPRLQWLAPLKLAAGDAITRAQLLSELPEQGAPFMIAALRQQGQWLVEQRRGFVVPDGWRAQAAQRRQDGALPA